LTQFAGAQVVRAVVDVEQVRVGVEVGHRRGEQGSRHAEYPGDAVVALALGDVLP
jgi:hypothetical protein